MILILCMVTMSLQVTAQRSMDLQQFYQKAVENHPMGLQFQDMEKINNLNREIISTTRLPGFSLSGHSTYQSDVIQIPIEFPGFDIPGPSQDQYRISLDVQQNIYDAGISKRREALQQASHQAELQQTRVQIYKVLDLVNRHFFQHFLLEENMRVVELKIEELMQRFQVVSSRVGHGTLPVNIKWNLEAELIRAEQAKDELQIALRSNLMILQILLGEDLADVTLVMPENIIVSVAQPERPELKLFALQKQQHFLSAELTSTQNLPRLSGFAQAGYGKPGLNLLSDSFDFYYIIGLRLSWNLWDWQQTSRQKQVHLLRADMIDAQQVNFEQSISITLVSVMTTIQQLESALLKDQQIIELQEKIMERASNQLENGVITSAEYLTNLNELSGARISLSTRRIHLMQAISEYNIIQGNAPLNNFNHDE